MKTVRLVYAGKRHYLSGEERQLFIVEETGEEKFFSNVKNVFVGSVYKAEKKGERVEVLKYPEDLGDTKVYKPEVIEEWRAADQAAKSFRRRKLAQKKAEKLFEQYPRLKDIREVAERLDARTRAEFAERIKSYVLFGDI